jgi:hypothetical protein
LRTHPLIPLETAPWNFRTWRTIFYVWCGDPIMFLPSSAKDFVPDGVVLRTPGFSIGPLDTFALWSRGNVDPLIHRVLGLLKEIRKEL